MRDNIYTIPVSEVFEPKCGCPICRMRDMLEKRCIEYIMGAAMMEPDIRIETNKAGFCTDHFQMMLGQKNRLSLALMLESHLAELRKNGYRDILDKAKARPRKRIGMKTVNDTCFVCDPEHRYEAVGARPGFSDPLPGAGVYLPSARRAAFDGGA